MSNNEAAGKLRFRIDLIKQSDAPSANNDGLTVENYSIIETRWADSQPIGSGHSMITSRNIGDASTHVFFIRHEDQFDNRGKVDHIRFDGRMYEIQNFITERERVRFLRLECRLLGEPSTDYNIL